MYIDISDPNVEGVYETQVPPLYRALLNLGCVCKVLPSGRTCTDTFSLDDLEMTSIGKQPYLLKNSLYHIYLYQHNANSGPRQTFALFLTPLNKALIIVLDSVRTNLLPNIEKLYCIERDAKYVIHLFIIKFHRIKVIWMS